MNPISVKQYLEMQFIRRSVLVLLGMILVSLVVTFFIARFKMATELENLATAIAKSYRTKILEGDIKSTESQVKDFLQLRGREEFAVLKKDFTRSYRPPTEIDSPESVVVNSHWQYVNLIHKCGPIGSICFLDFWGPAYITLPLYFDEAQSQVSNFLFLAKEVQFDWLFVFIVFLIFALGYLVQLFTLGKIADLSLSHLGAEITNWSLRLKNNPKDQTPLSNAPFAELVPLRLAIEGLNTQIAKFESAAEQKAKLMVLRGIAHDILEPVNQLQLSIASLDHLVPRDDLIDEIMGDIEKSMNKVSSIAGQVKTLNQNPNLIGIQQTDLNIVVDEFIKLKALSQEIVTKKIKLIFESDLRAACFISFTKVELERILQNLIQNAVHASSNGSKIWIKIFKEDHSVILKTQDEGCGIPTVLQERIFEPEFTTKSGVGTGLGLSIVRYICEERGASLTLESEVNEGTAFIIKIPINTEAEIGGHHELPNTNG